jgi:hypothetical protein
LDKWRRNVDGIFIILSGVEKKAPVKSALLVHDGGMSKQGEITWRLAT